MKLRKVKVILYRVEAKTKETLFSFFDTAYRFVSAYGEPPSAVPEFKDAGIQESPPGISGASGTGETGTGKFRSLEEISEKVKACKNCGLHAGRKNAVPGAGAEQAFVLIIGEGPGAEEDLRGEPFVGRSGQLLDKMLEAISLSRLSNVYIANVVKCRPPGNRDPLPAESAACSEFLKAQIDLIKPKAILVLGRIAAQNLLATKEGINRLRGRFFDYKGIPLMPTYHPSALLRDENLKRPAWEDLKLFREKLRSLEPEYERKFAEGKLKRNSAGGKHIPGAGN